MYFEFLIRGVFGGTLFIFFFQNVDPHWFLSASNSISFRCVKFWIEVLSKFQIRENRRLEAVVCFLLKYRKNVWSKETIFYNWIFAKQLRSKMEGTTFFKCTQIKISESSKRIRYNTGLQWFRCAKIKALFWIYLGSQIKKLAMVF